MKFVIYSVEPAPFDARYDVPPVGFSAPKRYVAVVANTDGTRRRVSTAWHFDPKDAEEAAAAFANVRVEAYKAAGVPAKVCSATEWEEIGHALEEKYGWDNNHPLTR